MEKHNKTLGSLFLAFAAIQLVLLLVGYAISSAFIEAVIDGDPEAALASVIIRYGIASIVLSLATAEIIVGMALIRQKKWATLASLINGVMCLPLFPLGSALGCYAIVVFLMHQSPSYNPEMKVDHSNAEAA